jgi:hypothetical protein
MLESQILGSPNMDITYNIDIIIGDYDKDLWSVRDRYRTLSGARPRISTPPGPRVLIIIARGFDIHKNSDINMSDPKIGLSNIITNIYYLEILRI